MNAPDARPAGGRLRAAARVLFGLVFAAGVVLAIVYPRTMEGVPGDAVGRWPVYLRDAGFLPVETGLSPADLPAVMTVELRTEGPLRSASEERQVLELAVFDEAGDAVFRSAFGYSGAAVMESPQSGYLYHRQVGTLATEGGPHRFVASAGRDFEDTVRSAHLVLNGAGHRLDPRLQPAGFIAMVVGVVGFGLTLFRRRESSNSGPPPPHWGRG